MSEVVLSLEPDCFLVPVQEPDLDEAANWAADLSRTEWEYHMAADGMQVVAEKMEKVQC